MKHSLIIFAIFLLTFNNNLLAQSSFTTLGNFQGAARSRGVSFTIGQKGYMGTGVTVSQNFN